MYKSHVRLLLPSSWVLGDPSSLSSPGCVFHPKSSTSESRSPSTGDTFHSVRQDDHVTTSPDKDARHSAIRDGVMRSEGAHLELLQLPDVAFTLTHQLSHLVLVFLLLQLPLRLLSLLLLQ